MAVSCAMSVKNKTTMKNVQRASAAAAGLMTKLRKLLVDNYELGRGLTQQVARNVLEQRLAKYNKAESRRSSSGGHALELYELCYQPVIECSGKHAVRPRGKVRSGVVYLVLRNLAMKSFLFAYICALSVSISTITT